MKQITLFTLLFLFAATMAYAHAGEVHTYLGTITKINGDGSFVMKMTNGNDRTVLVSPSTTYSSADGQPASASDLEVGRRVSAKISKDGKTALNVKLSIGRKAKE